ncbi:MAG: bifunctional 3-deoxy-7-phosphoheptulonate synthase/chorismate mutase type II [Bacteroidaceae bacterium]|nr:bifunctional 3-deoxy-7-phosphoheptulonate synthase/chorismate mutase type II [Bacteroidaceae bacterium]
MKDITPITLPGVTHKRPIIIAGPCSAESEQQTLDTARSLAAMGIKIFRAGIWKPRTKPGCFEGVGSIGLPWLQRVKAETGMYTATEVATVQHVEEALKAGVDLLWIGARTTANPFSMQLIADALKGVDIPIMVKNPVNPDLELWIGAIERLYNAGLRQIGVIHRGFTSYEKHLYRNLPHWHIPIELRRRLPHISIFGDPSHIGGSSEHIAPLSQQAMDLGYEGLIIESHCNPATALSDAQQQVTPAELANILSNIVVREVSQITETLSQLRQRIDNLDNDLISLLAERMRVSREIGHYKKENNMPIFQAHRYDEILTKRMAQASSLGMSPDFMKSVLEAIHEESVQQQVRLFNEKNK